MQLPTDLNSSQVHEVGVQKHPIAIVGIGCRLPGEASTPSRLWELLRQGKSGHCPVPRSRFNADGFLHPDPDRPGSIHTKGGYFIQEDIRSFENEFFGINNLEANSMDPQQRKLLEVVYESFENAGARLEDVNGSNTGVFVGNFTNDFMINCYKDPEYFSRYSATGAGPTVLSNRITHCFDLRGPSFVLDTACSSSLYALHSACISLDTHDCNAAVVASANLIQSAEQQLIAVKAGILSPDGISHTFDESANGYGRAEGVSALYLKRLDDAIADGDPVRAVIRGTAVNGNGRTPGIMQPSVKGQQAVIRTAYRRAGLDPRETGYVELHGTGTKVGDPIEVEAVARVFRRCDGTPILVGGIKPALGHSEGASGISSIIKVVLSLENNLIPGTIGVSNVNPGIKLDEWNVEIVRENREWPAAPVRRASVNSFGFGGANGHAIIEAAPYRALQNGKVNGLSKNGHITSQPVDNDDDDKLGIYLFSAATQDSLVKQFGGIMDYICDKGEDLSIKDLAYTLNCRRSRLESRGFLVAPASSLRVNSESIIKPDRRSEKLDLTLVYTGQGAQWPGLGSELIRQFSSFRQSIRNYDRCLQTLDESVRPSWTIEQTILDKHDDDIHLADRSQPICTAVQMALTDLLYSWNIKPKAILGHSSGEIAAAYASGHIDYCQAILSSYLRGFSVSLCHERGAMLAIGLSRDEAQDAITEFGLSDVLCVACVNSPKSSTLSGDSEAVDKLLTALQDRGVFARRLKTGDKAYHSFHMQAVSWVYELLLQRFWRDGKIKAAEQAWRHRVNGHSVPTPHMFSSVTKTIVTSMDVSRPSYWRRNLESPVEFEGALCLTLQDGPTHFVEIGPHSALELPIIETAANQAKEVKYLYNSAISRGKNTAVSVLNLVGSLFCNGHDEISFKALLESGNYSAHSPPNVLTDLPAYPWDYGSPCAWYEPRIVSEFRNRKHPRHDLLGSQIPGGSKTTTTWRNILNVDEISWLKDHRLGPSIIFPAAAYIVMAIEAVCQVNDIVLAQCPGVTLKNISFLKAMDFHLEQQPRVEIFTELGPLRISNTTTSSKWWRFSVSSISRDASQSIMHAVCVVGLSDGDTKALTERQINLNQSSMEKQASRVWYDKFTQEGLNWGPQFAVMEDIYCDSARRSCVAAATTHLVREDNSYRNNDLKYIAHPINIDSMLQTAFVATTGGWTRKLQAKVPVHIETIEVSSPAALDMDATKPWSVESVSESVGFGTVSINAELINQNKDVLVRMHNVRAIRFQGNAQKDTPAKTPLVRVAWKPDITALPAGPNEALSRYLDWFEKAHHPQGESGAEVSDIRLAGALDLIAFKSPALRILTVGFQSKTIELFKTVLRADHYLRRFESFKKAQIVDNRGLVIDDCDDTHPTHKKANGVLNGVGHGTPLETKFDIVIISDVPAIEQPESERGQPNEATLSTMAGFLSPSGFIVCPQHLKHTIKQNTALEIIEEPSQNSSAVSIGRSKRAFTATKTRQIVLVRRGQTPSPLDDIIQLTLSLLFGIQVQALHLHEVSEANIQPRAIVVSTVEATTPLLSTISQEDMKRVQILTNNASKTLWITNGSFLSGNQPDHALVRGIAGPLMLEQPALQLQIFDIDDDSLSSAEAIAHNIRHLMENLLFSDSPLEPEVAQKEGVLHALRWEPEITLNAQFELKQHEGITDMLLEDAGRCELSIKVPGQMETIHFATKEFKGPLPDDHVEIHVQSVGLNAKDLYALGARVDTKGACCSCECSGIVTAIGEKVQGICVGDRVVAMAPGHFATYERFPHWAMCKLKDEEDFNTVSTIPIIFSTVIYGLRHRANLQEGESVLIHSATGGVGIAAIQLAKDIGAEIFATVGNEAKKDYLVNTFNINPDHIFSSRNSSFFHNIMKITKGRGVDVVLNSLTGDLLQDSFRCCAEFGRFIEIGKRDILDHGLLDMTAFRRNVSFIAFDLSALYLSDKPSYHRLWHQLLHESMDFIRSKTTLPYTALKVVDAANIEEAFRYFMRSTRMGKVAVSFENPQSKIRVLPDRYESKFNPDKTYLMIGCLGGLGRSLTKWMMSRGARRFVFLGRTGMDKPAAQALVEYARGNGVDVQVVRGDVGVYEDVERCIHAAKTPIGGVIQGAMALRETIWTDMTVDRWHRVIRPKVQGTWHLHNALRKEERDAQLDWFIMTSSTAGTIGAATESNYCAANAFLDAFARYRNNLGLPAVAIGYGRIAEVGYLHDHPEIESIMDRRGIQAITEDEMIQIMDLAIAHQQYPNKWQQQQQQQQERYDGLANAHLLTGIDFTGLQWQRNHGFEGNIHVLLDPRASLFAAAFERSSAVASNRQSALTQGLPAQVVKSLVEGGKDTTLLDTVQDMVAKKISNLILLPIEKLRLDRKLGDFGMDSMLAAEFRTYIFQTLEIDVPFMMLLDKGTTVNSLTAVIVQNLKSRYEEEGAE